VRRVLLVCVLALAAAAPAAATGPSFLIRGDTSFAGLSFLSTLPGAKRVLGTPTSATARMDVCTATWPRYGIVIKFFSFEQQACTKGTAVIVTMTDPRWHTAGGLHVGDAAREVKRRHPRATLHPDGWWLVTRKACELGNFAPYASLLAKVRSGHVTALVLTGAVCD
jgi:hypothetical protein